MQQQQMLNPGVGAVPSGPALVYMPVPIRSRTYHGFQHKQSIGLGITQIIIGILCIIFNSVAIGFTASDNNNDGYSYIGHGIWCGAMFIITGGLGVGAGLKKTRCLIVSFMVMCIISQTTTISLLTIAIIGAVSAADYSYCQYNYNNYGYGYPGYPYYYPPCKQMDDYEVILAMEAMMAISAFIAGVIAIWGSAICCGSGVCCCSRPLSAPFIAPQPGYYPNGAHILHFSQSQTGGQNVYIPQSMPPYSQGPYSQGPYSQGMMAQPYVASYAQPGWAMQPPIYDNANGPYIGQTPPQYPATLQVTSAPTQPTDQDKF